MQAGTGQEATNINLGFIQFTLTSYYAWTEFLPQEPNEQLISNFTINPGDEIFTEVSVGGNGTGCIAARGVFRAVLHDEPDYRCVRVGCNTRRAAITVNGREALWIMERPTVGGSLPDLANYDSAVMYNASARKANSPRNHGYVPDLEQRQQARTRWSMAMTPCRR